MKKVIGMAFALAISVNMANAFELGNVTVKNIPGMTTEIAANIPEAIKPEATEMESALFPTKGGQDKGACVWRSEAYSRPHHAEANRYRHENELRRQGYYVTSSQVTQIGGKYYVDVSYHCWQPPMGTCIWRSEAYSRPHHAEANRYRHENELRRQGYYVTGSQVTQIGGKYYVDVSYQGFGCY